MALLGEQEARAHGDAVGAVGERGDEPAAVVEAAGAEHRDLGADRVDHLREQQRGRHRAGVAAALAALGDDGVDAHLEHLLGVAARADGRHHDHAGVVAAGDGVLRRRAGEATRAARPRPTTKATRSARSGWSARKFTPNGASVRSFTPRTASRSCVGRHRDGGEDPEPAGRARGGGQVGARHPAHARSARSAAGTRPARRTGSAAQGAADLTLRQITRSARPPANRP